MIPPTPEQINEWSQVDFGALGFGTDEQLQVLIDRSTALLTNITGRPVDDTMPSTYDKLVEQSIQRMVEIAAYQAQADYIETLSDFQLIASFSAGSYSESRRSLTEIKDAHMIVGDPGLDTMLKMLLTPDQYDWWLAYWTGEAGPAFEVTEVAWMAGSGFYALTEMSQEGGGEVTGATVGPWSW